MTDFTELVDLAAERLGGAVLTANDEFFAEKENLLKAAKPVFIEGKYTDRGKWMDGWETRRRRTEGHDWCIIRLGLPGQVRGVVVDTAFFRGNYPEHCSIEAASVSGQPSVDELLLAKWTEILGKSKLEGDSENRFVIDQKIRATHLRLHIYPDGGVARLRVHGDVLPDPRWMGRSGASVDLAAAENGGLVLACNDMFFGSRHNLVMPGRSVNMGDGWETKRSRRAGPDWVVVRLAAEGTLERVELDTNHFKGNFPESAALYGARGEAPPGAGDEGWEEILPRTKLQAHTRHFYDKELLARGPFTAVRMRIWPDGGVSRLRLHGALSEGARETQMLRHLNSASPLELEEALRSCCGSTAWQKKMAASRPFTDLASLQKLGAEVWRGLTKEDWLEAFRAHPRIGEKKSGQVWASGEQAKVQDATKATLDALTEANRAYEAKFGHIYIVCATGKSAEEMLAIAKERLQNDAPTELARGADEQRKITDLRLEKLVHQK